MKMIRLLPADLHTRIPNVDATLTIPSHGTRYCSGHQQLVVDIRGVCGLRGLLGKCRTQDGKYVINLVGRYPMM